jgi:hypothetical protein
MREPQVSNHESITLDQVIELIRQERAYQDQTFKKDDTLPSGLTRSQRNLETTPFLVMLQSYISDALDKWTWDYKFGTDEVTVLQQLVKIAAIATAAIELSGFGQELIKRGVRNG